MENDELKKNIVSMEAMLNDLNMKLVDLNTIKVREEPNSGESLDQTKKLPLKLEVKFDLKSFRGENIVEKLNQWLKKLKVFFRVQKVEYDQENIEIVALKLKRKTLVW